MVLILLVKITVTLLVGLAASAACRAARASVRHVILVCTFGALVVLPLATWIMPAVDVAVPPSDVVVAAVVPDVEVRTIATEAIRTVVAAAPAPARVPIAAAVQVVWLLGAMALLASLGVARRRVEWLRRDGLPWEHGDALLASLAADANVDRPVDVLLHEGIAAPLTCGFRHPVVLLPIEATTWSDTSLRHALVHELEHIHRRDWAVQVAARALCALYWFHPLVWVAWRRLCLESERACDDAVLARADRADYAQQLVMLARRVSATSTAPMLSMAGRSDLSARVKSLLNDATRRGRLGTRAAIGATALAAAVVLALSPLRAASQRQQQQQHAADVELASPVSNSAVAAVASLIDAVENRTEHLQDVVVDRLRGRDPQSRTLVVHNVDLEEALVEWAGGEDVDRVARMLDAGADVNTVVRGDGTPLISAARRGSVGMARLLLDRGANPNLGSLGDGTPLIAAAQRGDMDMALLLLQRGADVDMPMQGDGAPLILAAGGGHLEMVRLLLDRGANIDQIVPGDESALIQASGRGALDVVQLLVQRGADVNLGVWVDAYDGRRSAPRREYRSPLSMAEKNGHTDIAAFLRASGANR